MATIKRDWSPNDLLKAAKALKDQFKTKNGNFDSKDFAEKVGVTLDQKDGSISKIIQERKTGKLKIVNQDKGKVLGVWNRDLAEQIPPEVEKSFKSMRDGDILWEGFKNTVNEDLKVPKQNAIKASQPNWQIDQGHTAQVGGTKSGSGLFANPHVAGNIYNEPARTRRFDNQDPIIGNSRRNVKPELHFDPKEVELSGGQLANNWLEPMAQFLTGKTGTNVEKLSQKTIELARDEGMSLQQAAAIQDRQEQLDKQKLPTENKLKISTEIRKAETPKKLFRELVRTAGSSNNPLANIGGDLIGVAMDGIAYAGDPNHKRLIDLAMSGGQAVSSLAAAGIACLPIPGARAGAYAVMKVGDNLAHVERLYNMVGGLDAVEKLTSKGFKKNKAFTPPTTGLKVKK